MRLNETMEVKDWMEKEYENYVKINQDGYGNAVIIAGAKVGKALTEGKTCEEAEHEMNGQGLTGCMAGCVASAIVHFHKRGEEFRVYWNASFGVKEGKGVVNPAVLIINDSQRL